LTPPAQFADAFMDIVSDSTEGSLHDRLSREFKRMTGVEIAPGEWNENAVPSHLRFNIRVLSEVGEMLTTSRDLNTLRTSLGEQARDAFMASQTANLEKQGIVEWDFGDLPLSSSTEAGITAYPALVDENDSVAICLFDHEEDALLSHQAGVHRLLELQLADKLRYVQKNHGISRPALMAWTPLGEPGGLAESLVRSTFHYLAPAAWKIRDRDSFEDLQNSVRAKLVDSCTRRARQLSDSLETYQSILVQLEQLPGGVLVDAVEDVESQLHDLVYEGFLDDLEPGRLQHYPRYLKAVLMRVERLAHDPVQDTTRAAAVSEWWHKYQQWLEEGHEYTAQLDTFRWLLEEFRVSQFAQQLGTREKVSAKRLEKAWREVS